jgi:hypothetical protein
MAALLALHFRMMWRGMPAFLRVVWAFLLVAAVFAIRRGRPNDEILATMVMGPMAFLLFGVVEAIIRSETLTWYAPLSPAVRTWARLATLALTGMVFSGTLVGIAASGIRLHTPAPLLAAHLWFSWIGGGLLVLFVGNLVRSAPPVLRLILFVLSVLPGMALVGYHLTEGCPWEVLLAEQAAVALLVALTRILHMQEELPAHGTLPEAWHRREPMSPEAAPVPAPFSKRRLERSPSIAVLVRAGLGSRSVLSVVVLWLLTSALPFAASHVMVGLFALPLAFQAALQFWRPFAAVPLSRPKVFVLLTAPILAVWVVMVAVQVVSSWALVKTDLVQSDPDRLHLRLPPLIRNRDADLSRELRHGALPRDPERLASLMSEAYRVSYGLEISPGMILAVPTPTGVVDTAGWLRTVESRFEPLVSRRVLDWRLLAGTAILALSLLSMINLLPGRIPGWMRWSVVTGTFLLPMGTLVLLSLDVNVSNHLGGPFRALYQAVFDRPGTLAVAFAAVSAALYLRHFRAFRTSETPAPGPEAVLP